MACRDYPHSRHLCAKNRFESTPHESYCEQVTWISFLNESIVGTLNLCILVECSATVLSVTWLPLAKIGPELQVIVMPLITKHGSRKGKEWDDGNDEIGGKPLVFIIFVLMFSLFSQVFGRTIRFTDAQHESLYADVGISCTFRIQWKPLWFSVS